MHKIMKDDRAKELINEILKVNERLKIRLKLTTCEECLQLNLCEECIITKQNEKIGGTYI